MQKVAIIITGFGDDIDSVNWSVKDWCKKYGVKTEVIAFGWTTSDVQLGTDRIQNKLHLLFDSKVHAIVNLINTYDVNEYEIILIGVSAGASAAFCIYDKCKNKISRLINICGRLKKGKSLFRHLSVTSFGFPLFKISVLECEKVLIRFNANDLSKIITYSNLFDQFVPMQTSQLLNVRNIIVPLFEHNLGISFCLKAVVRELGDGRELGV